MARICRKSVIRADRVRGGEVAIPDQTPRGFHSAASRMDQRWMTHPSRNHHRTAASTNIDRGHDRPSLDQLPQAGDEEAGERGDDVARGALTGHDHLGEWRRNAMSLLE